MKLKKLKKKFASNPEKGHKNKHKKTNENGLFDIFSNAHA